VKPSGVAIAAISYIAVYTGVNLLALTVSFWRRWIRGDAYPEEELNTVGHRGARGGRQDDILERSASAISGRSYRMVGPGWQIGNWSLAYNRGYGTPRKSLPRLIGAVPADKRYV
jgi:hypothetical protein